MKLTKLKLLLVATIFFYATASFAQVADQRAENIQNGTFNIFMSADQSFYYHNNNRNNDPYGYGYWVTAHTLETLADAYQRTRNVKYRNQMKSIIAGIRKYNLYQQGTYRNDYYDDLEWLGLACFNCYNATKDPEFLDAVHLIWAEIKTGYANGKMSWKKGCTTPCNNAIGNSPAIILAVKLYKLQGDPANLQMAKDIHAWMKTTLLNADGGIWDSPDNHNPDWQFSYNSGMFIGACLELAVVTGQQSYIDDGIKAAEFMMNFRNYNGGVFFLNETGQGDGGLFKGIFAKWFIEFVRVGNLTQEQKERYLRVIHFTSDYTWANAVNKSSYLVAPNWSNMPSGTIDLSTQSSGLHLFESVASLNKVHVYQDINYAGFYSQLPVGSYTLAQLQAKGVIDNDITSFTVPMGYSVTVYENDNFTGASKTFTANSAWLADWNDRITSLRISDDRTYIVNGYQDINYGGYTGGLNVGNYTLAQLQSVGILDNDLTSFKITPGFKVVVYDGDNFTGTSKEFTADVNWLADWNDKISSLKVLDIRPYVFTAYQDVNYGGYAVGLDVGDYTLIQLQNKGILNNDITSLKLSEGYMVTVYDGDNFSGASAEFTASTGWLADWNDRITSLKIRATAVNGNGDGLTGSYFNGMNFEIPVLSRKDANLNMNWGSASPGAGVNVDQFTVRWSGQVQPRYSGEYTFHITSDNGRRVWINNQLIIDRWVDDWDIEYNGKITLTAGQKYDIKVEMFENNGGANTKLEWSSASQVREIIPTSQLYSNPVPSVSITSPANNASFNAPATITINTSASDNASVAKVDFYNGNTLLGSDNTSPFSYSWSNVAAGTYTIKAVATDNSGAFTISSSVTIVVQTGTTNQFPSVNITAPTNNAVYTAPAAITINANASDDDGTISNVQFYNGTTLLNTDNTSPYSFSWTNVAVGTYSITAKATDNQGAITTSSVISVKVNAPANNPPAVNIIVPANNTTYTAPASITINATATDSDGTISNVQFYSGTTLLGNDNTSPYGITWNNVAAGTYTVTARATDNQGAVTISSAITVRVNTPPVNPCSGIVQYVENAGYVAGSVVQNAGNKYQCKPWPYSGWCNGAAWAYAPGSGAYWGDAWTLTGSCSARMNAATETTSLIAPNPTSGIITLQTTSITKVSVYNSLGTEVISSTEIFANGSLDLSSLSSGIYLLKIETGENVIVETILKK